MIELKSFTDNTGTDAYNFALSQRRPQNVLRCPSSKNVPQFRISIVGFGETNQELAELAGPRTF